MGRTEFYAYDLFGNMKSKTDKNGAVFTLSYSPEGMLLSRSIQKDGETESTSYTYDVLGNVRSASGPSGTINYTYDNFGRLTGESSGGIIKTYSYDLAGNRTQFNLTNNGTEELSVLYTYDKLNMLTSAVSDEASIQYTYDINGRPLTGSTGDTLSEYTYNNGGYLTSLTNKINGTASEIYSYQYDLAGNRLSESKLCNGTNSTTSYTYDNVNRLKTVTEPDGGTISYDFDKSGNIVAKTMTHPSDYVFRYSENGTEYTMHDIFLHNILYTYNKNNELLSEQNSAAGTGDSFSGLKQSFTYYTYDSNGNTLSRSNDIYTESYTYDMLNRLKAYTDAEDTITNYVYDAAGKRVSKQTGSSAAEFNWDGGYCVLEKTNGLTRAKNYIGIYGVFARSSSGEVTSFLKNGHGDVSALVSDGQIVKTYAYDPYGQEKNPVSTDTNPFRYCGEYYDAETGNIYLRNRYYDPATSRMLSEDPARAGTNWYIYCNNNPINYVDPSGLDAIVITTSTMSVFGNAHTSVLAQDNGGNWYYFYWGNKNAVLLEVSADKLTDLGTFNAWLVENGAGKAGEKTDKPLHDSSDEYTTGTYIEGDFSASVSYFLEQAKGANMSEEIKDGKHEYKNNSYGLFGNNCMTVSFDGLKKGTLTDGTNFGDFAKFDGAGSIRPNDFRVMIRETFANQEFTRSSARNSAIGNIGVKKPWYMSQNYYNQGQKYGKMLRGY